MRVVLYLLKLFTLQNIKLKTVKSFTHVLLFKKTTHINLTFSMSQESGYHVARASAQTWYQGVGLGRSTQLGLGVLPAHWLLAEFTSLHLWDWGPFILPVLNCGLLSGSRSSPSPPVVLSVAICLLSEASSKASHALNPPHISDVLDFLLLSAGKKMLCF